LHMTLICWLNLLTMCTVSPDGDSSRYRQVAHKTEREHELIFWSHVAIHSNPSKPSHITIAQDADQELRKAALVPLKRNE
jgi:hypothetical protein